MNSSKKYWVSVLFLLLFLLVTSPRMRLAYRPFRPNIVLISLDAFRFKILTQLSSQIDQKPFLPQWIQKGIFFSQCYTTSPQILPAHASLFTGLYPRTHQVQFESFFRLNEQLLTLPEILKEQAGYETMAVVASSLLSRESGLAQGFQFYDEDFTHPPREIFETFYPNQRRAHEVVFQFQQWLQHFDAKKPFFAFLNFFDAHTPYEAPYPFSKENLQPYQAELYFLDQQLQQLMQHIQQTPHFKNTLFILVSTSGEGLQEHQEYEHGLFLYNTTICGSAFFYGPQWLYPKRIEDPISIIDVAPTLLHILDIDPPGFIQGKNLAIFDAKPSISKRSLFVETQLPQYSHHWQPLEAVIGTVPEKDFFGKYIIRAPHQKESVFEELYDLTRDPNETNNLSPHSEFQEILQHFRKQRDDFLKTLKPFSEAPLDYTRPMDLLQERDLRILNRNWVESNLAPLCPEDPLTLGKLYYGVCHAKELLRGQQWPQAESLLQKMLALDPNHPESLFLSGQLALRQQDFTTALSFFNHPAIRHRVDASLHRSLIFNHQHEWERSEECLLGLLQRYPEYAEVHKQLAYLYKEIGLSQKAIYHLECFLKWDTLQNSQEIITIRSLLQKLKS